ncbi:conjugal transfer protein TrbL [Microlunatus sp. GCM10028923]|uniref:conjugal transfer protein TrbL n=1 Tax=Microlunatus sp. GCM10028923 TaxID=3273400 RepID=UPI00360DC792
MISAVCEQTDHTASDLAAAPFEWVATAMGEAAAWMYESVWSVFDTTTLVDVTSPGYVAVYNLLFGVAVFIMMIFFCLQLLTGLVRRDPTALTRAALGLARAVLGTFVVLTLTALLLETVDQLCIGIVQAAGETMETLGDKITLLVTGLAGLNAAASTAGPIITIFLAGLAIAGAAIVWLSLLIRKSLLLVAIVFAPLAFAGTVWDATKGWVSKWAMFVIALIVSKLVLVVMLLVAVAQVAPPIEADLASISDPLAGIVLMLLACFAPYLTYKFISFIGFDTYHAISSEQEAKTALNRPVPIPQNQSPQTVLGQATRSQGPSGDPGSRAGQPGPGPTANPGQSGAGGGAGGPAGGNTGTGAATTGGTSGTAAAGGTGATAAAGPAAAAAIAGANLAKRAATAGPRAGTAIGTAATGHSDATTPTPESQPNTDSRTPDSSVPATASPSPNPSPADRRTASPPDVAATDHSAADRSATGRSEEAVRSTQAPSPPPATPPAPRVVDPIAASAESPQPNDPAAPDRTDQR